MADRMVEHKTENILWTHLQRSIQSQDIYDALDVFRYDDSQMTDRKSWNNLLYSKFLIKQFGFHTETCFTL